MVIAHRALRNKLFRHTVVSTDDAATLFDAGSGQAQGGRQYQEDRCAVVFLEQFPSQGKDKIAFFAIYDGHGSELEREDWAGAIKAALIEEDQMLLDRFKNETAEPAISGSTVAVCCINLTQGELVVSNLGDSHVILAEREPKTEHPYHIRRLTEAHKPEMPGERARIEEAGGEVINRSGTDRLGSLNMSRAVGDLQYKNPVNTLAAPSESESRGNFLSNDP